MPPRSQNEARRFTPRAPDRDRTQRILSLVGELLREPGYDQLRLGQLLVNLAPPGEAGLFYLEDASLEAVLREKLASARAERADGTGPSSAGRDVSEGAKP